MDKSTEEILNYELYKQGYENYTKVVRKITKAVITACPRQVLIKILKEKKIIQKDWVADREKYKEREK